MARFVPTLPQWPCSHCRTMITRNRAYCTMQINELCGIQRKVNGAYCLACARRQAEKEQHDATRA